MENKERGYEVRNYFICYERQLKEIKYNPRLRDIQDSVSRVAELEEQLSTLLTELKMEYTKLEMKSKFMKGIVEK